MNSSPDSRGAALVVDGSRVTATLPAHELRSGHWTRLGGAQVLGDAVTEHTLSSLAEETRDAARAQGYATGWAEGRRAAAESNAATARAQAEQHAAAEARREAEHRAALHDLVQATERCEQVLAATCEQVEAQAVELALALTEELLGRELRLAEHPGADAVRRALGLLQGEPAVRVRVSAEEAGDVTLREVSPAATVVPDPALRRGEVVVEAAETVVDARVWAALERVREVLSA